jgi:predicted dehydrogenase
MSRPRIGLIGLGMAVGPHARSLRDLAGRAEVVGAWSPSAQRRCKFEHEFGFPQAAELDGLLSRSDAVAILTPPSSHLELVRRAAAAGKHVLLEKPLDISTARAGELVAAARTAGVTLGIVLQHRFRPAGERLRTILAAGQLG